MAEPDVIFSLFVVFTGAALCATAALFARQAMIVAYIAVGALCGPGVLGLVKDASWLGEVSEVGIMFLLYLLGMNMVPRQLLAMLREALVVTLGSALVLFVLGGSLAWMLGFSTAECAVIGAATMFSSTIIGLKLLPTTTLHHQRMGQVMISILLLQDLLAIVVLLGLKAAAATDGSVLGALRQAVGFPLLMLIAWALERWLVEPLLRRFDQIHEYMFLVVIAWCLAMAEFAKALGLSHEIGAFVAGVALAACPAALYLADALRPLRDFFLILFFFALGARIDPAQLESALPAASLLAALMLLAKPWCFRWLLVREGENPDFALQSGVRLGQISEFSLLIAVAAVGYGVIGNRASLVIQFAAVITFVVSSYLIVLRYPTPIGVRDNLRSD
jgi:Kef-type K+ transport system membrane component KefB